MKKFIKNISVLLMAISSALVYSGCNITPEQGKVIANQAGLYSAVVWIASSNPSTNQIVEVKDILNVIKANANKIEAGKTYTETVYPEVAKVINTKVKEQDRALCMVASIAILNGLDTLFALHPEWNQSQAMALNIVGAYVDGANNGLSFNESDPVMKQARRNASAKAKFFEPAK